MAGKTAEGLEAIRARLHEDLRTIGRGALADEILLDQLVTVLGRSRDVEALIDEDGLQVTGSTGQIRANGLLAEARQLRREVVILIKDLGIGSSELPALVRVADDGHLVKRQTRPATDADMMDALLGEVYVD